MIIQEEERPFPFADSTKVALTDRRVLVAGGSSGIGYAVSEVFSNAGARVVVADVNPPDQLPARALYDTCDVTQASSIDHLYQFAQENDCLPDLLVCCAGIGIHEKLSEGDPEKWAYVLQVNLMGALRLIRAFTPAMLERGSGDVVLISSVSAQHSYPYGGIYAASKSALETVAETLRLELQPMVRVTTIVPGVVDTNFFSNTISGSQSVASIGWGALSPEEVADAILYVVTRPKHFVINSLTMRPVAQPL